VTEFQQMEGDNLALPEEPEAAVSQDEGQSSQPRPGAMLSAAEGADAALDFLSGVLDRMDLLAEARLVAHEGNQISLEVVGEDVALLIGKHGQTLDALQLLISAAVARKIEGRPRVILDAEGYRERRAETLRQMALSLAHQVLDSGQEAVMEGLSAAERRVIHTALADEPGIGTYSEGEEPQRRVVITPTG
jgi:spoIIIJ-associated protein